MLLAMYQLFQQMEKLKRTKNEELEGVLFQFIQDIKMENEQLQQLLNAQNKDNPLDKAPAKQTEAVHDHQDESDLRMKQQKQGHNNFDISSLLDHDREVTELSVEARMLQLQKEGYSVAEIAQKMNRGKTEVELMLTLHPQLKQNT